MPKGLRSTYRKTIIMGASVELGDKIWLHYGSNTLIVGYLVDHSPDNKMIALSPLTYEKYKEMNLVEKAGCPVSWCELRGCSYLCHISFEDLKKAEPAKPTAGFGGFRNGV